ncbi:helix-turn-helix domain-containing protein [Streptomyces cupreus]|uniref:Helix-turn-helix domain-containing protein n=1 Tax=Streptomyces cupreus TaxID=2759956 RepID=A0A7X1IZ75_9ACTN|nr:helix-turn-helix domain-containing protein [Streptomyces cupreus]MBC2901094.1 helix-turn-helix domain-containing protein [Streptomyces cupreus]
MSSDAREWVWEHSSSRGTARLVLLSIADRVPDEQCTAWASLSSLIERTNASRTAVRDALEKLTTSGELEQREDLQGPQRTTVYRLPLTAAFLAKVKAAEEEGWDADVAPATELPVPELKIEDLRQYGIWPKNGTDSAPSRRVPTGSDSGPSRRNPTPRRYGFRPLGGADSDTQNRSEPKVNRKDSSSAAVISASQWQVDPATHAWARQQGHLARLGEDGLRSADAKWRAYRTDGKPRSAGAWAADWRAWVAREHTPAPGRPRLYALPGSGPAPEGGMTRAEAHTAALLAALDEPTGTE